MISEPSGNSLPSVTSARAPTRQFLPMRAWLRMTAPMPISEPSPIGAAVEHHQVADRDVVADGRRNALVGMDDAAVLHVRAPADARAGRCRRAGSSRTRRSRPLRARPRRPRSRCRRPRRWRGSGDAIVETVDGHRSILEGAPHAIDRAVAAGRACARRQNIPSLPPRAMASPSFALTKIQAPRPRAGLVRRESLEQRMAEAALAKRLVLLAAPAGFGKTAALTGLIPRLAGRGGRGLGRGRFRRRPARPARLPAAPRWSRSTRPGAPTPRPWWPWPAAAAAIAGP